MGRKVKTLLGVMLVLTLAGSFAWAQGARGRQAAPRGPGLRQLGERTTPTVPELGVQAKAALLERFLESLVPQQRRMLLALVPAARRARLVDFFARRPAPAQLRPGAGRGQVPGARAGALAGPGAGRRGEGARRMRGLRGYRPGLQMRGQAARPGTPQAARPVKPAAARPQAAPAAKPLAPKPAVPRPKAAPAREPAAKATGRRAAPEELFRRADRDRDGNLSYEEALRAGLLVRRPQPPVKEAPVKKPPVKEQVPERRRMGQRSKPQARNPAGAGGLARGPQPGATSAGDREVLENWDILSDLLSLQSPEGGK